MNIYDLDTPALLLDVARLDNNLQQMAAYCKRHKLDLRPHTKTHKSPVIAHMQIERGACGITVAKLGEAEVMADAGLTDILIQYPIVGEAKLRRLVSLAARCRLTIALDSLLVAKWISQAATEAGVEVGVRVEFDTGFRRCGLPIVPESIPQVQAIQALPHLRWDGISVYYGHIMGDPDSRIAAIAHENEQLDALYALLAAAGIDHSKVSGGNTPAALQSHEFHSLTEIRPGTYALQDRDMVDAGAASFADCALSVLTTVVSTSVANRAIIDAGSKTLSADGLLSGAKMHFGYIVGFPDLRLEDLSEEHGHILLGEGRELSVGHRLRIIPNHVCTCVNLHDRMFVVDGEEVVDSWRIECRGKVV
jgi:D-serine deaminase-like pyridoxal phosphate-dependent protein